MDAGEFFRGLRRELGGEAFPYVWVPEWHPGGHGLHVHFAVGRFVPVGLIKEVWGRGIVHGKLIGDLPVGSGALEEARAAAAYLAKYVSKNIAEERIPRPAPLRGRAGIPAGAGAAQRRLGSGSDRAGIGADGLASRRVVGGPRGGGLARAAGVLVCLGWMTSCAKRPTAGPRKQR